MIDLKTLFSDMGLTCKELDSKAFQRTKKYGKNTYDNFIFPNAYYQHGHSWMDIDVYWADVFYVPDSFMIGDLPVRCISGETFWKESRTLEFMKKSSKTKIHMDRKEFEQFPDEASQMPEIKIKWKNGTVSKEGAEDWRYCGKFEKDGEEVEVSMEVGDETSRKGMVLYHCMQLKTYEEFQKLEAKKLMLGL